MVQPRTPAPYGPFPGMMAGTPPMLSMMQSQSPRDPMDRMNPEHQNNRVYNERKEGIMDRMDDGVTWRGSGAIYA